MLKALATVLMVTAAALPGKFSQREMSAEIYAMQSRLASLGYFNIKVTGMYGTLTEDAIKLYQEANDFEPTGVIDEQQLQYMYSHDVQPYLDSNRVIPPDSSLSSDSFSVIDQKITQSFEIELVTINKKATFKVNSSQGHLIGELSGIDTSSLNTSLRYPVIATIQGVRYPASMDINSSGVANLHFKDSLSFLGIPDSEHQYNISKLLGF